MKLKDGMFQVVKEETVTITVKSSFDSGNQVVAVLDDDDAGNNPFNFEVIKKVGQQHEVRMVMEFLGASDSAQYTVKIDGDADDNEGPFTRLVRKNSASHKRVYDFRVVKSE